MWLICEFVLLIGKKQASSRRGSYDRNIAVGVYVVKEYPELIYMCYAAHTLCHHTQQPNAATRDEQSLHLPEFNISNSDTGGSARQQIMGHNTRTMLLDGSFFCCFFCCILSINSILPIIFEVIEKNGDEAREFNKLIFVSN